MMKKLVLTGAAGRLGSYLREPLAAMCDSLVSTDIKDDIGTPGFAQNGNKIILFEIDSSFRAKRFAIGAGFIRISRRENLQPHCRAKLNCCRANAASTAMNKKNTVLFDLLLKEHIAPDGEISLGKASGINFRHAFRNWQAMTCRYRNIFSIATAIG